MTNALEELCEPLKDLYVPKDWKEKLEKMYEEYLEDKAKSYWLGV